MAPGCVRRHAPSLALFGATLVVWRQLAGAGATCWRDVMESLAIYETLTGSR